MIRSARSTAQVRAQATALQGTDLRQMRESNRMLILNCVRRHGAIARAEVARHTGLSRTTVGNIIDDLLKDGFVREGDSQRAEQSGNRRIVPVHFNATAGYILGLAMGRNHLTLLLSDLAGEVVHYQDMPLATAQGPEHSLLVLASAARDFVGAQGIAWSKLIGVGIGMPGPIDADLQVSVAPPRMPGWDGTPVRRMLADALQLPVFLDNNGNMGALAESRYGAGRDATSLLYCKIGSGIGSGLIIGGKIYRGTSGSAGEIGHMTVDPRGPRCDCGSIGCLEAIAGSQALLSRAQQAGATVTTIPDLIAVARAGDGACRAALDFIAEQIGIGLGNAINFFNPDVVVLDGSTMRAGELLLPGIERTVKAFTLPAPFAHTRIVPAALSGRAIALGGIATVIDAAFDDHPALLFATTPVNR